jgi:hypothetical protein
MFLGGGDVINMTSACECSQSGFCSRRNTKVSLVHWERCQSGAVEIIDGLYERFALSKQSEAITQQTLPQPTENRRPCNCGPSKKKVMSCSSCGRTGTAAPVAMN